MFTSQYFVIFQAIVNTLAFLHNSMTPCLVEYALGKRDLCTVHNEEMAEESYKLRMARLDIDLFCLLASETFFFHLDVS